MRSLSPFRLPQADLVAREVEILDAQRESLEKAQPGAVQQARNEPVHAPQMRHQRAHLRTREHDRQPAPRVRARHRADRAELSFQHVAVEEDERAQRLILRRCRHALLDRERRQELPDFLGPHRLRMALAVINDEPAHPVDIRLLRAPAPVPDTQGIADLIEQPRGARGPRAAASGASPFHPKFLPRRDGARRRRGERCESYLRDEQGRGPSRANAATRKAAAARSHTRPRGFHSVSAPLTALRRSLSPPRIRSVSGSPPRWAGRANMSWAAPEGSSYAMREMSDRPNAGDLRRNTD